ncbi:hypothetical protein [Neptunomonas antarctica]|uniref:Exonuclease domain-containing protein n=1 Tax=Neptunomonas antarctica TaxID=619304 RepID=A0A1N7KD28_9GAMM|nr:hypothetical protein [Neptunomonas antarctica]SIS59498.1 hypothetical protein SAMN05421760_102347 [Neptunomonas antarctica]
MSKASVICIDIEASGMGSRSYPIEIAWKSALTGKSDAFLINPDTGYNWTDWDPVANDIHGIDRDELVANGISVRDACRRLNRMLEGQAVTSDAYEFDYFWMQRLFESAMMKPAFVMQGIDKILEGAQLIQYRLVAISQVRAHRAMNDVNDVLACLAACDIGD